MAKNDFPEPKIPLLDGEEQVVAVHSSGVKLVEGMNTNLSRYYCSNCKKKIHCYITIDKETQEATIHDTCKDKECECKCRTHYACKNCGHLHAIGELCNFKYEPAPVSKETDDLIEKINKEFLANNKSKEAKIE